MSTSDGTEEGTLICHPGSVLGDIGVLLKLHRRVRTISSSSLSSLSLCLLSTNIGVLLKLKRQATVRAVSSTCESLTMSGSAMLQLLKSYPIVEKDMTEAAQLLQASN